MIIDNKLTWLHLSDIHFHPKTGWRDEGIQNELISYLRSRFSKDLPKPDLVFCTGDIAFGESKDAPMSQQYDTAITFFNELLACCELSADRLFLVPGNHDVNRREISDDQQARLVEMAGSSREHVSAINQRFADNSRDHRSAMERLQNYGEFIKKYRPELHNQKNHIYAKTVDINGYRVGVAGFNSAWSCAGPEDDRHIWLAAKWQFKHMEKELHESNIKIGLIHHPFDWLNESERQYAEEQSSKSLDFLLHGHTHSAWVKPSMNCTVLAAGAVGAGSPEEFGVNLVTFNKNDGGCCVHLFGYREGWVIRPVPQLAPDAKWHFTTSARPPDTTDDQRKTVETQVNKSAQKQPTRTNISNQRLFGRADLLTAICEKLTHRNNLALYGISGNGKTTLIKELHKQPTFKDMRFVDIHCGRQMTTNELFRRLVDVLQNRSEELQPPTGTLNQQIEELKSLYPSAEKSFIWLNNAHLLTDEGNWRNADLAVLLDALIEAFPNWIFVYELNEKPQLDYFGRSCPLVEVPGLTKHALAEFFNATTPKGMEEKWKYKSSDLNAIYQWLGGGHGGTAHTLAAELLSIIAKEQNVSPLEVYLIQRHKVIDRLDERLLSVIYDEVLNDASKKLIKILALYRYAIPQDHADDLEDGVGSTNGWQKLRKLGLLPIDSNKDHFLHGFVSSWVRQKQLGLTDVDIQDDYEKTIPAEVSSSHSLIAKCWQKQIGRQKELLNFQRANEAFYHLLCSGELGEIDSWIEHLTGQDIGWTKKGLWSVYNSRRETNESVQRQQEILQLLVNVWPLDHKAWRFLGECQQKTEGLESDDTLKSFERSLSLSPSYAPYLANLGKAMLSRGKKSANDFLAMLETYKHNYPRAIDNYVQSIQNSCIQLVIDEDTASIQRLEAIRSGSTNPAYYNEEANHTLLNHEDPESALKILDLAVTAGISNTHSAIIRCKALQKLGRGPEASILRKQLISAGIRNAFIYNDEAAYQLDTMNDREKAIELMKECQINKCDDTVTSKIYKRALNFK
ncbi:MULTISPECIES: metallophosphoesterase [unclassified Pseudomonas]|uniref:metallophosphoesterase n=1 Tax=unclassified Pseudomonas TaxID=196821 RepID=UPI0030D8E8A4